MIQKDSSPHKGVSLIAGYVKKLTSAPGVYRMLNEKGEVLYVGKAKNLKKRVLSYTQPDKLSIRIQRMVAMTTQMEFVTTHTEAEALLLEANLIKSLKPRYNIIFRDDKSFPYILLDREENLPACLTIHRGAKTRRGDYFGPFASRQSVGTTVDTLSRIFKLRTCRNSVYKSRERPCLQYHIKRCTAPCVGYVSLEDYEKQVQEATRFLLGKTQQLQKNLAQEMEKASSQRLYEKARDLRDQIRALSKIQEEQGVYIESLQQADILAVVRLQDKVAVQIFFFRHGTNYGTRTYFPRHTPEDEVSEILEAFISWFYTTADIPKRILLNHPLKDQETLAHMLSDQAGHSVGLSVPKRGASLGLIHQAEKNALEALAFKLSDSASTHRLLEGVAGVFGLPRLPQRIEVYDNSHHQGREAYGAMIVATPEGFDKKSYRKFSIKEMDLHKNGGDDYAMMREVFRRRFKGNSEENLPDLILVDGGKGQLSAVQEVLQEKGLTHLAVVAISKGPHRQAGREQFHLPRQPAFSLEPTNPILYYLQRLRDEAHRFVITTHRQKKQKTMQRSRLDEIPGIGAKRKKELLQHFGSVEAISEAGINDLKKVSGISEAVARLIYNFFHEK